jgi:hypothetical protein
LSEELLLLCPSDTICFASGCLWTLPWKCCTHSMQTMMTNQEVELCLVSAQVQVLYPWWLQYNSGARITKEVPFSVSQYRVLVCHIQCIILKPKWSDFTQLILITVHIINKNNTVKKYSTKTR